MEGWAQSMSWGTVSFTGFQGPSQQNPDLRTIRPCLVAWVPSRPLSQSPSHTEAQLSHREPHPLSCPRAFARAVAGCSCRIRAHPPVATSSCTLQGKFVFGGKRCLVYDASGMCCWARRDTERL